MRLSCAILTVLLAACGPVIVVVGNTDAGLDDCASNDDCPPGSFCNFATCAAAYGQCALKPITSPQIFSPACGCDGVTYLNIWRMELAGVSQQQPGECDHGPSCDQGLACPNGATCGRITPDSQCNAGRGRCWNVPATCPWAPDAFLSCSTNACVDLCEAMHGADVFKPSPTNTCP